MAMSEAELALYWEDLKDRVKEAGLKLSINGTGHMEVKKGGDVLLTTTVFLEVEAFLKGYEAAKP